MVFGDAGCIKKYITVVSHHADMKNYINVINVMTSLWKYEYEMWKHDENNMASSVV